LQTRRSVEEEPFPSGGTYTDRALVVFLIGILVMCGFKDVSLIGCIAGGLLQVGAVTAWLLRGMRARREYKQHQGDGKLDE